jgi:stress-induced morphogen
MLVFELIERAYKMGTHEIYTMIKQATKPLAPVYYQIVSVEDETLTIRVVSDSFIGMPMVSRFKQLADLFEKEVPYLPEKYTLVFEAWTKNGW